MDDAESVINANKKAPKFKFHCIFCDYNTNKKLVKTKKC